MHTTSLLRHCSILSALALAGCPSDDENATGSASNSASASESSGSDSEPSSGPDSNSATMGSNSATMGTADSSSSGDASASASVTETASATATESSSVTDTAGSSGGTDSASSDGGSTDGGSTDGGSSDGGTTGAVSASATDSDTNVDPNCEAPGDLVACDADTNDPFEAMGLGCAGEANQVIPIDNAVFSSPDAGAWRIARQFGTFLVGGAPLWGPREGEQMLIISTGAISAPNNQGVVTMAAGIHEGGVNNGNPDGGQLPAPMSPNDGGQGGPFVNCDGVGDCSNTLEGQWDFGGGQANDLLWMQFDTEVPGGTNGFSFDFAYFSAEFPEWVDTAFNDIFLAWSASETYTGNLCFINDQPCTVTSLCDSDGSCPDLAYCDDLFGCANPANGELAGTGFDGVGGATGWFTAQGSAAPLETLQLTFAVFDMTDSIYDTAVLLDNWHWDCEGCVPSEVMGCGIEPTF